MEWLTNNDIINETADMAEHDKTVARNRAKESEQKKAMGAICKEHRLSCGVSANMFYEIYGVKQTTLSEFERGNSGNILFLFRYADLECSVDEKTRFIQKLINLLTNGVKLDVDYTGGTVPDNGMITANEVSELVQKEVKRQLEKLRGMTGSEV